MNKIKFLFLLFLVLAVSAICFAYEITSKIEDVPNNETLIEFRGCVRGNTGIIRELCPEIDSRAFILGVEIVLEVSNPEHGWESFLKYRFIGKGKDIRTLKRETVDRFISKYSSNLREVK